MRNSQKRLIAAVATSLIFSAAVPAHVLAAEPAQSSDARLVNTQVIVSDLGPSGVPLNPLLINTFASANLPLQEVTYETSLGGLRYVDQRGAPRTDGAKAIQQVGGSGQRASTTEASFSRPIRIGMHAEYWRLNRDTGGVDPLSLLGQEGDFRIKYRVTNTAFTDQLIKYEKANGKQLSKKLPVFAPFLGTLRVTLPAEAGVVDAPQSVQSTDELGRQVIMWQVVAYPPIGSYEVNFDLSIKTASFSIPAATLAVAPVTDSESPQAGFSKNLIGKQVAGDTKLSSALSELNYGAVQLTSGMTQLTSGLGQINSGATQLSTKVDSEINPLLKQANQKAREVRTIVNRIRQVINDPTVGIRQARREIAVLSDDLGDFASQYQVLVKQAPALGVAADRSRAVTSATQRSAQRLAGVISASCPGTLPSVQCDALKRARNEALSANDGSSDVTSTLNMVAGVVAGLPPAAEISLLAATSSELSDQLEGVGADLSDARKLADQLAAEADSLLDELPGAEAQVNELESDLTQLANATGVALSGSQELESGASQLQKAGTKPLLSSVDATSKEPALAKAYLAATYANTKVALPYPPPAGATASAAYVFSLQPVMPSPWNSTAALVVLLLLAGCLVVLAVARIRRNKKLARAGG